MRGSGARFLNSLGVLWVSPIPVDPLSGFFRSVAQTYCTTLSITSVHDTNAIWGQSWPFSLHSVANISGNMLAIIHNVSHWVPLGVTRYMVGYFFFFSVVFWLSSFCVFLQMCTEVIMCFVHENDVSLSHGFKCFLGIFFFPSLRDVFSITWVLTQLCQRVSVFFRWSFKSVHVTLHLVWETQEVRWAACR